MSTASDVLHAFRTVAGRAGLTSCDPTTMQIGQRASFVDQVIVALADAGIAITTAKVIAALDLPMKTVTMMRSLGVTKPRFAERVR